MFYYVVVFILAFLLLAKSSEILVRSITALARFFKVSEYVIAFIFMSMATSIPELFVGISSSINHIPEFSLGNILGANFLNITLVIGLVTFLGSGLNVGSKIKRRNFLIIFGLAFLPLLLASDGMLSRGDGLVLIMSFSFYIYILIHEKEYFTKTLNHVKRKKYFDGKIFRQFARFFIGILLLILASSLIVWAGLRVTDSLGLSALAFGILFISLGTALPELAFGVRARFLKHGSMTVGNSLGSIAFNSTLIVGIVSLINPIKIDINTLDYLTITGFLFLGLLLFNIAVYSKSYLSRKEGLLLFLLYVIFLITEYFILM